LPSLNPIGIPFIELLTIDSTNNYAMGLVREGMAQHGTAVFAHEQTSGKGQRNKEWKSEKNKNLALSLVLDPKPFVSSSMFLLSMAIAISVQHFLEELIKDDITIKWPNDLYWRDRKAGGILIENLWQGNEWRFAIAGIGININQLDFGDLNNKAVSVKQILNNELEPLDLAHKLCKRMQQDLSILQNDHPLIISTYKSRLYKLNESVKLKKDNRLFHATIKDVTIDGRLVVQHAIEEKFSIGDLEWV
jgi:BirA family transcriptional regulator, biotin operon repressor / biotin---[acetyl-CoA-carboxylase] ligase